MGRKKRLLAGGCILVLVVLFVCVTPVLLSTVFCPQDTEIATELESRYGMAFTVQDSARLTWSEARQSGISGFLGGRQYQICPTGEPEASFQVEVYWHGGVRGFPPLPHAQRTLRESYWQLRFTAALTEFLEEQQIPYEAEETPSPVLLSIPVNAENWEEILRQVVPFIQTLREQPPFSTASAMERALINPLIQFLYQGDSCQVQLRYYSNLYESVEVDDIIGTARNKLPRALSFIELGRPAVPVYLLREELTGPIPSGHSSREDLIRWFQETYTDAPIVVAEEPVTEAECISYPAYLEQQPELVFLLQSAHIQSGMRGQYIMQTDFQTVYGAFYMAQYQSIRPTHYVQVDEETTYCLELQAAYETPEELGRAVEELQDILAYLDRQEYSVQTKVSFLFRSYLCDPANDPNSLGSGSLTLKKGVEPEAALHAKQKELLCELTVWCAFYGLHPEWFSPEELDASLAYSQTEAYHGQSISAGTWSIIDPQTGDVRLRYPFITPHAQALSFAQTYQILQALNWESLTGSEAEFSFMGADGSTYALSYTLWEGEEGTLISRCTRDGAPMDQRFRPENGSLSHTQFTELTGLVIREPSDVTYQGPGPDGTIQLPSGPGQDMDGSPEPPLYLAYSGPGTFSTAPNFKSHQFQS